MNSDRLRQQRKRDPVWCCPNVRILSLDCNKYKMSEKFDEATQVRILVTSGLISRSQPHAPYRKNWLPS